MSSFNVADTPRVKISPYIVALILIWSAITIMLLAWNVFQIKKGSLDLAYAQAHESLKKDILFRHWIAMHGGVYVPITAKTPPNPYLSEVHRDIPVSPDLVLTLINPAYMTRQIHEMAAKAVGAIGHISSLQPLRPENAADDWEARALASFQDGEAEASGIETINGVDYLRLIRPLRTERGCLKCHAEQRYKVGDIRGGLGIAIPIAPFRVVERSNIIRSSVAHGLLWVLGLAFAGFAMHRLNRQLTASHKLANDALIESEAKYRGIFNESIAAIYIFDLQQHFLDANQAGLDLLGYNREELLSMSVHDIDADPAFVLPDPAQVSEKQKIVNSEHRLKTKDGHYVTVLNNAIPIRDVDGNGIGIQSMLVDISPRKQAEHELRKNQAHLRTLVNALPDLVWLKDPDGVYMACNTRLQRYFGKEEKEIIGRDDFHLAEKDLAELFRLSDRIAIEKGGPSTNEEELIFADDGHREIIETIKMPMYTDDGELIGVLGIGRDITERKLKEKIQAAKLRLVDYAATHSTDELLQTFIDEAETLTESAIGFYHFVEDDQQTLSIQTWSKKTLNNGCAVKGDEEHYPLAKAGVWVDCVRQRKPVVHNDYAGLEHKKGMPEGHVPVIRQLVVPVIRNNKIVAILGVGNKAGDYTATDVDIVQQFADLSWETINYERAKDAQRESEERYRSMMEAMNDAAYICSSDYRIEYLNPAMIRRIGRDATGERCHRAINNLDQRCPWCSMEDVRRKKSVKKEIQSPMDNRYYQVSNSPILHADGTISKMTIYTDITQIKAAEEQLRQAQKMESLGNLAGGIAHDFNNILSPIIGLSEMLMMDLPPDSFERENARDILKSAQRASDLVRQILSFSRQSEKKRIPIRIQKVLQEVFKLMRSTIPSNISIKQDISKECGQVLADPTQLHQIAMNLVTNAYHALEEDSGEITLSLEETTIGNAGATGSMLKPGKYALISVSDTGCGIDPAITDKIFEPYFTTKELGKGTGLGLSVVYGIVKDHGGDIRVQSRPGEGTTFSIYLPVIESEENGHQHAKTAEDLPGGNEHILLVDDEVAVMRIEKLMLERLGYHVTARASSIEALEAFKECPARYDLVVSDMTMPNMTGDQLARTMIDIRADIPIIICTGFSERIDRKNAGTMGIKGVLMKPIIKAKLSEMVRNVLDEASGGNG